jgi:glucan phosphoethanolaminetransferase (alkaline phosphatase superfamily)
MLKHQWFHIKVLFQRLGILVLLYAVCRIIFFLFNKDLFPDLDPTDFLSVMWFGLRFDIASIIYINLLFILLHIFPSPWRETLRYQQVIKAIFYLFNGFALMLESGDFIYFRYGLKRTSTHELGLANDASVLPMVIRDFWFVFLLVLVLVIIVELLYRKTEFVRKKVTLIARPQIHYPMQITLMLIILSFSIIGARGGIQPAPLSPASAGKKVTDERLSELVINTPFSIIYALAHRNLVEPKFFSAEELNQLYSPYHKGVDFYQDASGQNVCLIVLESFSKEYIGYFSNGNGYTPFLDSLIQEGQIFTNFYANGKSSNQGIIATVSGIPVLMEEPFISSLYKNNAFIGIGSLLQQNGYYTAFFHGANNGSMGFDAFTKRAGFNAYYGRNEFGDDTYFDGNWGIFDEPFLQYTATEMSELPQPFFSEIFTISSHHPYTLPKEYEGKFPKGSIPMLEVVGYADLALRNFFKTAAKQPWFNQTLFILTADHNGPPTPGNDFYKNQVGAHSTWMLLYKPDGTFTGSSNIVAQQTDILPTILDYVGYNGSYCAFGTSVFDTIDNRFAFAFHAGDYHLIYKDTALIYSGQSLEGLYHFPTDSLLSNDLRYTAPGTLQFMINHFKAIIQSHHQAMIHNKLTGQ